jgi:hypothetical protein
MKPLSTLLACLFLVVAAHARPSVEVLTPQPSSQSPKITVLHDRNPVQHTKVEVSTIDGKTVAVLSADESGAVVLPRLHAGRYTIAAVAPGRLQAYLIVDISKSKSKMRSEFALQLQVGQSSFEELVEAAETNASPDRIPEFNGTVVDPSGAAMPNAKIYIYPRGYIHQRGSDAKKLVCIVVTDVMGRFAAHLPDGRYTAVFTAQGFETRIEVFEIKAGTEPKEKRIRLDLGAVS